MPEQHLIALMKAQQARVDMHAMRAEIGSYDRAHGARLLAQLIVREDPTAMRMPVERALLSVRGVGSIRARLILRAAEISLGTRRIRDLSPRQRNKIALTLLDFDVPGQR